MAGGHHVADFGEIGLIVMWVSTSLFFGAFVWLLYIALEPYVRRRWPTTLVAWSRVLAGNWRDPLVGRDVLIGSLAGMLGAALFRLFPLRLETWLGTPPAKPAFEVPDLLLGARIVVSQALGGLAGGLGIALGIVLLFFLFRVLLRREWIAAAAFVLVVAVVQLLQFLQTENRLLVVVPFALMGTVLIVLVLLRVGLVALATWLCVGRTLALFPITLNASAWYAWIGFAGLLIIAAIVLYGFYVSRAGRPMFGSPLLDD